MRTLSSPYVVEVYNYNSAKNEYIMEYMDDTLDGYISSHNSCGDNSVATKRNLVEILRFRHFSRHVVFDAEGDKFRNKRIEDYITVSVVIDMECGNTKN